MSLGGGASDPKVSDSDYDTPSRSHVRDITSPVVSSEDVDTLGPGSGKKVGRIEDGLEISKSSKMEEMTQHAGIKIERGLT